MRLRISFARAADGFGALAGAALGGLLVVTAELHLAEDTFALHLLLQDAQRLIDIVFADENLHFDRFASKPGAPGKSFQGGNLRGAGWYHRAGALEAPARGLYSRHEAAK